MPKVIYECKYGCGFKSDPVDVVSGSYAALLDWIAEHEKQCEKNPANQPVDLAGRIVKLKESMTNNLMTWQEIFTELHVLASLARRQRAPVVTEEDRNEFRAILGIVEMEGDKEYREKARALFRKFGLIAGGKK